MVASLHVLRFNIQERSRKNSWHLQWYVYIINPMGVVLQYTLSYLVQQGPTAYQCTDGRIDYLSYENTEVVMQLSKKSLLASSVQVCHRSVITNKGTRYTFYRRSCGFDKISFNIFLFCNNKNLWFHIPTDLDNHLRPLWMATMRSLV